MNFFIFLIKKPVGVFLVLSILIISGVISSNNLPVSYYPDFTVPAIFINTPFPGADPQSVEQDVTRVIEDSISSVSGLESVTSTSQESFSLVQISFDYGVDVKEKTDEIQKEIDSIKSSLPQGTGVPEIVTINDFVAAPVSLIIYSDRRSEGELKLIAEKSIAPELSKLPACGNIIVNGGLDTIVRVEINPELLIETGISISQIALAINFSNTDFPIGDIKGDAQAFSLRLEGKFKTVEDIGNVIIVYSGNKTIFLKDIADISIIEKTQTRFSRVNENPVVSISIRKPQGGNTIDISTNVNAWLSQNKNRFPSDVKIEILKDESIVIKKAIQNVINSLLLGALLAAIIIYLILGNFKNTLVIIVSIPVSIIISFLFMKIFNLSINTVSLGGLGMATGMVVDSAVVVMENAYRYLEENKNGTPKYKLIGKASAEVALPISASVLTTVVVFLPLAFTTGLAKVLLGELSLVIVFALLTSILVSITIIPVLSFILLTIDYKPSYPSVLFNKFLDGIKQIYLNILKLSLKYRVITMTVFTGIMIAGCSLVSFIDTGMLPDSDQGEFQISISYPRGVTVEYTNQGVTQIEHSLLQMKDIKTVNSIVGEDVLFGSLQPYSATINVFTTLAKPTREVISDIRQYLSKMPGLSFSIRIIDATAGIRGNDLEYDISGNDLEVLREQSERFLDVVSKVSGVINMKSGLSKGISAYIFVPDKKMIAATGLSVFDLAQLIRNAKSGQVVSTYKWNGYDIDINIQLKNAQLISLRDLENMPVLTKSGVIPLKVLGRFVEGSAPAEIKRIDRVRAVNITGDIDKNYSKKVIESDINKVVSSFDLPEGYRITKKGSSRAIAESFKTLGIALLIGIMLVFMVMGIQFNSIKLPFVIIVSIPFSMPGAFLALLLTNSQLNLPSFLGIIMLAGIVVNNGIILIDFIVTNRSDDKTMAESIIEAGSKRYRPVMMTTLTTIIGMLFLALNIGGGGEALAPLAIAVIGGLLYSISVSLILVPVIYTFFDAKKR